jgi:hypothetical protein
MSELRLYTFINFYLSSIQQGIQSGHVLGDMFVKYKYNFDKSSLIYNWAEFHKTMIVLNGGPSIGIKEILEFLDAEADDFSFIAPYAPFYEDDISLEGIMTGVGIILPEEIYDAVSYRVAKNLVVEKTLGDGCGMSDQFNTFREYEAGLGEYLGYLDEDYFFVKDGVIKARYAKESSEGRFLTMMKSCPLAR